MGVLSAFLHPEPMDITKEIIISDRFKEDGKPVPFKIRTISQAENDALVKKAQKVDMVRGRRIQYQDDQKYTNSLIVACTVQPDFRDAELCQAYGTLDPLEVPGKMQKTRKRRRPRGRARLLSFRESWDPSVRRGGHEQPGAGPLLGHGNEGDAEQKEVRLWQ